MINTVYAFKSLQTQKFTSAGKRVPVTLLEIKPNTVTQVKKNEKDGYTAVQIATGQKKNVNKAVLGHTKNIKALFLREIRTSQAPETSVGDVLKSTDILKPGDLVNVRAVSKGKGFAGVVKRHGFRGGPKTHGQSDRHRAPGSVGQTTTPGRVYKGKRMAGHMGAVNRTQRNLVVLEVEEGKLVLKGTIPGPTGGLTSITKTGESKNFLPLLSKKGLDKEAIAELEEAQSQNQEAAPETEEAKPEEATS